MDADLRRFVFTSTIGTIGLGSGGQVDRETPFDWGAKAGAYIRSRVDAEKLVLGYARDKGLPRPQRARPVGRPPAGASPNR